MSQWFLGLLFFGFIAVMLVPPLLRERKLRLMPLVGDETERRVGGRSVFAGWDFVWSTTDRGGDNVRQMWRYRVRVPNVLPNWLTMCWPVRSSLVRRGRPIDPEDSVLPVIVFGQAGFASAWTLARDVSMIAVECGDLILESDERVDTCPMPKLDDLAISLATACVEQADGLQERLIRHVACATPASEGLDAEGGPVGVDAPAPSPEALKMLVRGYASSPRAWRAIKDALRSPSVEMRLIAAIALGEDGCEELERIARSRDAPIMIREQAIEALSTRNRYGALLQALSQAPDGVERRLLQAVRTVSDPGIEHTVLRFLESDDEEVVESAADVLARSGTRLALPALHAATQRRFSIQTMSALKVAVELITDRLELGSSAGALALVEADRTTGALSMNDEGIGALSTVNQGTGALSTTIDEDAAG
ncbi:MAG: HEAT repeat domain-containing protein [Deltaproteobacteria bacterium]|nr:HEAT repeat domain-containing protein [Deltaproteobacteria bacterium]